MKIIKKYGFEIKKVSSILNKRKGERNRYLFLEDYTLNPYIGCSFDCSYCYINGSKYGENTYNSYVKENARDLVYKKLKDKFRNKEKAILNLGSATDPYMPIESELYLTRDILKIILRFRFPVHIITKSNIILRDTDILKKIDDVGMLPDDVANDLKSKTLISFSFSTTDNKIAEIFEPNAPTPSERLKTIKVLSKEGFNVGVAFMPILPYISDSKKELKKSISLFSKNNVSYILPGSMSLFGSNNHSSRIKYYKLLEKHFPEILDKTKALFSNREYPSRSYQNSIYKKVAMVSEEFKIKNSII